MLDQWPCVSDNAHNRRKLRAHLNRPRTMPRFFNRTFQIWLAAYPARIRPRKRTLRGIQSKVNKIKVDYKDRAGLGLVANANKRERDTAYLRPAGPLPEDSFETAAAATHKRRFLPAVTQDLGQRSLPAAACPYTSGPPEQVVLYVCLYIQSLSTALV